MEASELVKAVFKIKPVSYFVIFLSLLLQYNIGAYWAYQNWSAALSGSDPLLAQVASGVGFAVSFFATVAVIVVEKLRRRKR